MTNLRDVFEVLKLSSYRGVDVVMVVDSGKVGPVAGITIMTHGNEPCGLEVLRRLMVKPELVECGKVIVCLNNLRAAEAYFAAQDFEARRGTRFVDINMNRLPEDVMDGADAGLYEVRRARELKPIWDEFDFALDIHSTEQPSVPMLIAGPAAGEQLADVLPVEIVIKDIIEKQLRYPALAFYREGCVSVGMEAGSHEDAGAGERAWEVAQAFLRHIGVMEGGAGRAVAQKVYRVRDAVVFPNDGYELVRVFPLFAAVRKGEVLARNGAGHEIISPLDGVAIFAPVTTKVMIRGEEVMFLCVED